MLLQRYRAKIFVQYFSMPRPVKDTLVPSFFVLLKFDKKAPFDRFSCKFDRQELIRKTKLSAWIKPKLLSTGEYTRGVYVAFMTRVAQESDLPVQLLTRLVAVLNPISPHHCAPEQQCCGFITIMKLSPEQGRRKSTFLDQVFDSLYRFSNGVDRVEGTSDKSGCKQWKQLLGCVMDCPGRGVMYSKLLKLFQSQIVKEPELAQPLFSYYQSLLLKIHDPCWPCSNHCWRICSVVSHSGEVG